MPAKAHPLTKAELREELDNLFDRIAALINQHFSEAWFAQMSKKLDKIDIKNDLIHESYLDMMVLIKLHHQKLKDLEKILLEDSDIRSS